MNVIEHPFATKLVALSLYELNITDHGGKIKDNKLIKPGSHGCLLAHHNTDSRHELWWRCENYPDHVYHYHKMNIRDKINTLGKGCNKCRQLVVVGNKFSNIPDVQAYWNWEKNTTTPDKLSKTDKRKFIFTCPMGHEFERACVHFGRGQRCSYCSGQRPLAGFNTFDMIPDAKEWWDYEENDKIGIKIDNITQGANRTVNFKCPKGHKYKTDCYTFTNGQRCDVCYKTRTPKLEDSFANAKDAKEWWDYEENDKLGITINKTFKSSRQRVYFRCKLRHSFDLSCSEFTDGVRCGICSGHRPLAGFNTFDMVSDALQWWDYEENDKLGYEITDFTKSSQKKVHFKCLKGHKYVSKCGKFTEGKRCPVCAGKKLIAGVNTFDTVIDAKEWWDYEMNDKLGIKINNIAKSASVRVHFKCPKGHKFVTKCSHFTEGSRCKTCSLAGYSRIAIEYIECIAKKYNIVIQHGTNVGEYDIPKTKYKADGYIEINGVKIVIEFHGELYHGFRGLKRQDEFGYFNKKKTFGELYQQTVKKENKIRELGYKLVVMWEDDYKQLREKYANGDFTIPEIEEALAK
ncbi:hypothetical protein F-S17_0262 [Faustovirus]|nr:hypothetical protein F-S17_0262 [Faustovirus]SMH63532.1 Putative Zinc-ribbon domain containing protein [Faustovirus]